MKQQLLGTSAMALKLLERSPDLMISDDKLHNMKKRGTPIQMMKYRLAIQLYKINNSNTINDGWLDMNFHYNFNERNNFVRIFDNSRLGLEKTEL